MTAITKLHRPDFDPVDQLLVGLANCGYALGAGARILDFGCGTGDFVYRLRDRGFDARGFDIHNVVVYRRPEDRDLFVFSAATGADTSDMRFDPAAFSIAVPDDSFDLVFSSQTLEHVQHLGPAMREIARVLAPGGVSLHVYPRREALIEPHILVPLAGRFRPWWWLYLWALLGVRNGHQRDWSARQTADLNAAYFRSGVHYRTDAQMLAEVSEHFSIAHFFDRVYYGAPIGRAQALLSALKGPGKLEAIARWSRQRVLLTESRKAPVS